MDCLSHIFSDDWFVRVDDDIKDGVGPRYAVGYSLWGCGGVSEDGCEFDIAGGGEY